MDNYILLVRSGGLFFSRVGNSVSFYGQKYVRKANPVVGYIGIVRKEKDYLYLSVCILVCVMMYLYTSPTIKKQMETENKCINSDGCLMLFQK